MASRRAARGVAAAAIAATLGVTAFGTSAYGSEGATRAAAATKSPILIWQSASYSNPIEPLTDLGVGAAAAVKGIDASGGINGHPLKLTTCDTGFSANAEIRCAKREVASKAVADIQGAMLFDAGWSILTKAKMAAIGVVADTPADFNNPIMFPFVAPSFGDGFALTTYMSRVLKQKKIAVVSVAPENTGAFPAAAAAAGKSGATISTTVTLSGTDLTPEIFAVRSSGADGIVLVAPPSLAAQFLVSAKANGLNLPTIGTTFSAAQRAALGANATGFYEAGAVLPPEEVASASGKLYLKDLKAYSSSAKPDVFNQDGWLAVMMFAEVARKQSTVTRASTLAAWRKAKNVDGLGMLHDYSATPPFKGFGGQYPRLFNTYYYVSQIKSGGGLHLLTPEPLNLLAGS